MISRGIYLILLAGGLCLFICFVTWYFFFIKTVYFDAPDIDLTPQNAGLFGDSFGALNAIFSGLAFSALLVTIFQQQKEISEQRFDNLFFQHLNLHALLIRETIYYDPSDQKNYKGRECYQNIITKFVDEDQDISFSSASIKYKKVYSDNVHIIHPCISSMFFIIRKIDQSKIRNKEDYIGLFKAQLSFEEMILIFFEGLFRSRELKILVEKYAILEALSHAEVNDDDFIKMYDKAAYGGKYPV